MAYSNVNEKERQITLQVGLGGGVLGNEIFSGMRKAFCYHPKWNDNKICSITCYAVLPQTGETQYRTRVMLEIP